jgi:hypothetical protein
MFTARELDLLATPLSIQLERAALARDIEALPAIQAQMEEQCVLAYDSYVQWVALLQTFIVEHVGECGHDEAIRYAAGHAFPPFLLEYRQLDFRGRVETLASHLRASGSTFSVEEDDERVRFTLDPWGGAVRQWRRRPSWQDNAPRERNGNRYAYRCFGAYEPDGGGFAVLHGARPLTRSQDSLPCYFAVEALFYEAHAIELLGMPLAVITQPDAAEGITHLDVLKDPARIPVTVYERVGFSKPLCGVLVVEAARRVFTDDELATLATPLSLQVEAAAARQDWERLLAISSEMDRELVRAKDPLGILITALLTWIARHLGEATVEQALMRTAEVVMAPYVENVRGLSHADLIRYKALTSRAHGSTFRIEEHEDTIVLRGTLGASGRMRIPGRPSFERTGDGRVRYPTFGVYDQPACLHRLREPRPMTYGLTDYPIYACHGHVLHEVYCIDVLGYPLWVEDHDGTDPDSEDVHMIYKDPTSWPEEYYARVGRSKTAAATRLNVEEGAA